MSPISKKAATKAPATVAARTRSIAKKKEAVGNGLPWKVEGLRFTAFLSQGISANPSSWWLQIVGEPPERRVERPKIDTLVEEGSFEGGALRLAYEPLRFDLKYSGKLDAVLESGSADELTDIEAGLRSFLVLVERWLQLGVPVDRLALGAELLLPVGSLDAGYEVLAPHLPNTRIRGENVIDFVFQVNRRRMSLAVGDMELNRLARWSVVQLKKFSANISVSGESPQIARMAPSGPTFTTCRLELDLSTSADRSTSIRTDLGPKLVKELAALAIEIAREGDKP